jgi:hypothetical protein
VPTALTLAAVVAVLTIAVGASVLRERRARNGAVQDYTGDAPPAT